MRRTRSPRADWAFADCRRAPLPGTPDPPRICLKDGFRAGRIYELVYTAKDPLVLGVGLAATRDIVSFFRHAAKDAAGTPNPVAGAIDHAVSVGDSQSGNFIQHLHPSRLQPGRARPHRLGRRVPRIAARQTPMNLRFALPGGAAGTVRAGERRRGLVDALRRQGARPAGRGPARSLHGDEDVSEDHRSVRLGGVLGPAHVARPRRHRRQAATCRCPPTCAATTIRGPRTAAGAAGFAVDVAPAADSRCTLPDNPNPEADQTRALTRALVEWVTTGTPPPASRYPTLANGDLVPATRAAIGLPDIPGLPFNDGSSIRSLRYDFGAGFDAVDLSGVMSVVPPRILGVIPT